MIKIDPKKQHFMQILFDGASNVQKAGQCMAQHYPRAEVNHGAECSIGYGKVCQPYTIEGVLKICQDGMLTFVWFFFI